MTHGVTRRGLLQSGAASAAVHVPSYDVIQPDERSSPPVETTQRPTIDLKLEHEFDRSRTDVDIPIAQTCPSLPPSSIFEGTLYLVTESLDDSHSEDDCLLRTPRGVTSFSRNTSYNPRMTRVSAAVSGIDQTLPPSDFPNRTEVAVTQRGDSVDLHVDGDTQRIQLDPGEDTEVGLDAQTYEVPELGEPEPREFSNEFREITRMVRPRIGTTTIEMYPKLAVRNHGEMDVHWRRNAIVGPETAQWMHPVLDRTGRAEVVDEIDGTNIVAVPDGDRR